MYIFKEAKYLQLDISSNKFFLCFSSQNVNTILHNVLRQSSQRSTSEGRGKFFVDDWGEGEEKNWLLGGETWNESILGSISLTFLAPKQSSFSLIFWSFLAHLCNTHDYKLCWEISARMLGKQYGIFSAMCQMLAPLSFASIGWWNYFSKCNPLLKMWV